jgi:hypothetical protein
MQRTGRSPIEYVELPPFIPKQEQKWFREAIITFQSGKILAGLFYLRTFVEQFARRKTGMQNVKITAEEIFNAYAATIPENIRSTMPSLRDYYDKLSDTLHSAKEDKELFESAREAIEQHFDIRRVHKLEDQNAARKDERTLKASLEPSTDPLETETLEWIGRRKLDLPVPGASLDTVCRNCGHRIPPAEVRRIGFESVMCPACGREFVPSKASQDARR